jgi:hypothetical protein
MRLKKKSSVYVVAHREQLQALEAYMDRPHFSHVMIWIKGFEFENRHQWIHAFRRT